MFSYNYEKWIKRWIEMGAICGPVCNRSTKDTYIALRHDIDRIENHENIDLMASIEERNGIRSSYYILVANNYKYYNKYKILFRNIQKRGHEIGLHVSSMELSHNPWKAREKKDANIQLRKDIDKMIQDGFNLRTMSAHGSPFKYNNKDLMADANIATPVNFSSLFSLDDCILTDSRGEKLATSTNVFNELSPGIYYSLTHPQLFYRINNELLSKAQTMIHIGDIEYSELNRLA